MVFAQNWLVQFSNLGTNLIEKKILFRFSIEKAEVVYLNK